MKSKRLSRFNLVLGCAFFLLSLNNVFSDGLVMVGIGIGGGGTPPPPPPPSPPSISVTWPTNGTVVTNASILVTGTASSGSGALLSFQGWISADYFGGGKVFQDLPLASPWSFQASLTPGLNIVGADASNGYGLSAEGYSRIYYKQLSPLTVATSGSGTVTPNLDGAILETGAAITLKEKPAKGCVFAGWTGDVTSGDVTLNCVMRTNMVIQASFVPTPFVPSSGTYEGLVAPVVSGPPQLAGTFKAKITRMGKFTAKFKFGNQSYPLSGNFLADGSFTGYIHRKQLPLNPIQVRLQLDFDAHTMAGAVTDTSWSSDPTGALSGMLK